MFNDLIFDKKRLGHALASTRQRLGCSLRDVSKVAQLSPSQILRIESGEFDCVSSSLVKLCSALSIRPGSLIEYCTVVDFGPYDKAAELEEAPILTKGLSTPIDKKAYLNLIAGSSVCLAYLIRVANPVIMINGIEFPIASQKILFDAVAKRFLATPLNLEDRFSLIDTLQKRPSIILGTMGLIDEEIVVLFVRWYRKARPKGLTPWIPYPWLTMVVKESILL